MNTSKLGRALWLGGLLASVAACAQTPWGGSGRADWQQHCQLMQQQCQALHTAKTPEERQKLMQEHHQAMMAGGGCPLAGAHGGMGGHGMMGGGESRGPGMMDHGMGPGGMGPGSMGAEPTAEQLDRQIEHVELMLKQLKAKRASMGK